MSKTKDQTKNRKSGIKEALKVFIIVVAIGLIAWAVFLLLGEFTKKADESSQKDAEVSEEMGDTGSDSQDNSSMIEGGTNDEKSPSGGADVPSSPNIDEGSGLATVDVMMNFAGVEVDEVVASGTIMNMVENGGTCIYKFTNTSGESIELSSTTLSSASSMPCAEVRKPKADFAKGEWSVVLRYESNNAKGESEKYVFTIY